MANRNTNNVLAPQTAWELILVIVKKMPRQLLKTLPLTLLMGILGWLFNFWLMGWVNDGFNPSTWVSKNLIGVTGKMISATILWAMIGAIIPMMIHFIKSGGKVGHAIGDFFSQPAIIMAGIKKARPALMPFFVLSWPGHCLLIISYLGSPHWLPVRCS